MSRVARKRHIAKSITWRIVGTIDTCVLGWFISGDITTGLQIGTAELITKMILYYLHERIWYNVSVFKEGSSRVRHILKTITWRFVGSIDTIILGWIISGSAEVGLSLGGLEVLTKMILYYLHERVWYRVSFGLIDQQEETTVNNKQ